MNNLFENCISEINTFYNQKGYQLGWRFLTCSKKNLEINPAIALITLNPGGNEIPPDHPWESCENGNAYLFEQWGNSIPGKSSLQIQVQLMFEKIAQISQIPRSGNELLEDSFSAHFVPFRSPRLDDIPITSESILDGYDIDEKEYEYWCPICKCELCLFSPVYLEEWGTGPQYYKMEDNHVPQNK